MPAGPAGGPAGALPVRRGAVPRPDGRRRRRRPAGRPHRHGPAAGRRDAAGAPGRPGVLPRRRPLRLGGSRPGRGRPGQRHQRGRDRPGRALPLGDRVLGPARGSPRAVTASLTRRRARAGRAGRSSPGEIRRIPSIRAGFCTLAANAPSSANTVEPGRSGSPRRRRPPVAPTGRRRPENHMENERASLGGRHLAQRRRRRPTALLAAACILLILALGIGGFVVFVNQPAQSLACRSGSLPLQVVVSPDQAGVVTQAAAEYERRRTAVDDRCVDVQVRGIDSSEAAAALSTGWDEAGHAPTPDVWVPASSAWALQVALRQQASKQAVLIPLEYPKVATSPMVMAMPKPMAETLGWPRSTLGWEDLLGAVINQEGWKAFGHPEWGAFKLGKTDPNLSTPGLEALIGAVFAATGQTSELSVETLVKQEDQLRRLILGLERAPGQDADTPATFLANLQQADQAGQALNFVSAVPLDEKSVWDYNRGNAAGLEDRGGGGDKPEVPLVAVYPKEGTLEADHPWVVLRAPWVDDTKRKAAAGFLDYLRSEPVQARFQAAGFRTSEGRPGPQLSQANGLLPD